MTGYAPFLRVYTYDFRILWDSLDKNYRTEDAGIKKFIVARLLEFVMVDSKKVVSQVQDLQNEAHE